MQDAIGVGLLSFAVSIILAIILGALFLWLGAKIAKIKHTTFWKALMATIASSVITSIITFLLGLLQQIGAYIGLILSVVVTIWVIKSVFYTTWRKAIIAWFFMCVAFIIARLIVTSSADLIIL